jgi:hypothetical protein
MALLVGTTSLATAQAQGSGGPDGQRTDGAADNPASAHVEVLAITGRRTMGCT